MTRKAPTKLKAPGKEAWRIAVEFLSKKGLLNDVDYPLLESFCFAVDLIRLAEKDISSDGLTLAHTNKNGSTNKQANPAVIIYKQAYDVIERCSKKFGFNPLDRSKLDVQEVETDQFDNIMNVAS